MTLRRHPPAGILVFFGMTVWVLGCSSSADESGSADASDSVVTGTEQGNSTGGTGPGRDSDSLGDTAGVGCVEEKLPPDDVFFEFYEFCVEDQADSLAEVRAILSPMEGRYSSGKGSAGMIGCNTDTEYLFWDIPLDIPDEVLCALTRLPYIDTIGGGVYL